MLIESKTAYSYLIEHMESPSFKKVRDLACDFVRKLPPELCDELHESLNRGIEILDSEPSMQMYFYAFGEMHAAKLNFAFEHIRPDFKKQEEIEIIDYGCGQGLATLCFHDFFCNTNRHLKVKKITLIEPSEIALKRAALLCSRFFPNSEIETVNKPFDELVFDDIGISQSLTTLHLFSNVIDVESFDILSFSELVKSISAGDNEYIIVSPLINGQRVSRINDFVGGLGVEQYYENNLNKNELRTGKDWTCVVSLSATPPKNQSLSSNVDDLIREAHIIIKERVQDDEKCLLAFSKLYLEAQSGNSKCQNQLGIFFERGIGVERNFQRAFSWFSASAEQGNNAGKANLAKCYLLGIGTPKDEKKAFNLFTELYLIRYISSFTNLAECYFDGKGTEVDYDKGLSILNEACKENDPKALKRVALEYFEGKRIKRDINKGILLLESSAKYGSASAAKLLGDIYLKGLFNSKKDISKAVSYYTSAGLEYNRVAIWKLIEIFKNKDNEHLFGKEQYDVFVKAVHIGMPEVSEITITWLNKEPNAVTEGEIVYSKDGQRLIRTVDHFYFAGQQNNIE